MLRVEIDLKWKESNIFTVFFCEKQAYLYASEVEGITFAPTFH
jgi:hypothetical protein